MVIVIYDSFERNTANRSIDLDADTIKVVLVTRTDVPDQGFDANRSEIMAEVTGADYAANGEPAPMRTSPTMTPTPRACFNRMTLPG